MTAKRSDCPQLFPKSEAQKRGVRASAEPSEGDRAIRGVWATAGPCKHRGRKMRRTVLSPHIRNNASTRRGLRREHEMAGGHKASCASRQRAHRASFRLPPRCSEFLSRERRLCLAQLVAHHARRYRLTATFGTIISEPGWSTQRERRGEIQRC